MSEHVRFFGVTRRSASGAQPLTAEKLRHLTGEDHTPEFLADCEACDGKGYIPRTIHVYEPGCGFSHPDVAEDTCQACGGNGWFVCEAEGDQ